MRKKMPGGERVGVIGEGYGHKTLTRMARVSQESQKGRDDLRGEEAGVVKLPERREGCRCDGGERGEGAGLKERNEMSGSPVEQEEERKGERREAVVSGTIGGVAAEIGGVGEGGGGGDPAVV